MSTPIRSVLGCLREARSAVRVAKGMASKMRLVADIFLSRLLRFGRLPGYNALRTIQFKPGVRVTYRLNRGDIQAIREVWLSGAYRLPFPCQPDTYVDLGANIGLTSLWYYAKYRCQRVVAVEPDGENAALVRRNFAQNGIPGKVVEAAASFYDGEGVFASDGLSVQGHLAQEPAGAEAPKSPLVPVRVVSMPTVIQELPPDQPIDLLKIDIEGGEEVLLTRENGWLDRVNHIIIELHDDLTDSGRIVSVLGQRGFRFVSSCEAFPGSMTGFVRERAG